MIKFVLKHFYTFKSINLIMIHPKNTVNITTIDKPKFLKMKSKGEKQIKIIMIIEIRRN